MSDTVGDTVGVDGAKVGTHDGAFVSGMLTFTVRTTLLPVSPTNNTPLPLKANPIGSLNCANVPTPST